jgi:hypothetical protein
MLSGDIIEFSFVGMETQQVEVTSLDQVMNVTLATSQIGLEEVVVIGYGEQKKEERGRIHRGSQGGRSQGTRQCIEPHRMR